MPDDHDVELRRAALERVRELSRRYDDLIPVAALREGFAFRGQRISFGSFYSGIYRPRQMHGPAALTLVTAAPKVGGRAPYDDGFDEATKTFVYHYRTATSDTAQARLMAEADNRALLAAKELGVPVIHFHGMAPGQYTPVAPTFVTADHPDRRVVTLEAAMPLSDITTAGLQSSAELRRYATIEARVRLHQHRFRVEVMRAYGGRCAVCALREASLVQAAHIIEDADPRGAAAVVNGIALCAIHHLAYDRNVMGIDPRGVVHIATRLLHEVDGPMLRTGLQGFHNEAITQPRRRADRPDPDRLEARYEAFRAAA
ncbi:HNH endonuclease [Patulibacter defluvii]|uniref:HNH endonuclease n=1 Tax=Patulibacter defluvii TaxID=3095358 RepID=UPI002A75E99E|nr:HNH endonuclease [Patulibacter sp. DM4]